MQGVLLIAHHDFGGAHVRYVQRVVALHAPVQVLVGRLVVAALHVVFAQVTLPYVHDVEVYRRIGVAAVEQPPHCGRVALLQRKPHADGVGVVYGRLVAELREERLGRFKRLARQVILPEVQVEVGHVHQAQVHVVTVVHAVVLNQLLHALKNGQRRLVVARIIIVVAVICQEVELHVQRHEREVAVCRPVTFKRRVMVSEVEVYPAKPQVQAYVVFLRLLQRVGQEQCAAVPVSCARHVVGRHVSVAKVGAHVGEAFFRVAAEQQRVSLAVSAYRHARFVVQLVIMTALDVQQHAPHAVNPRRALLPCQVSVHLVPAQCQSVWHAALHGISHHPQVPVTAREAVIGTLETGFQHVERAWRVGRQRVVSGGEGGRFLSGAHAVAAIASSTRDGQA